MLLYHPIWPANIIYTVCVLHNISIDARLSLLENEIEYRNPDIFDNNVEAIKLLTILYLYYIVQNLIVLKICNV